MRIGRRKQTHLEAAQAKNRSRREHADDSSIDAEASTRVHLGFAEFERTIREIGEVQGFHWSQNTPLAAMVAQLSDRISEQRQEINHLVAQRNEAQERVRELEREEEGSGAWEIGGLRERVSALEQRVLRIEDRAKPQDDLEERLRGLREHAVKDEERERLKAENEVLQAGMEAMITRAQGYVREVRELTTRIDDALVATMGTPVEIREFTGPLETGREP